MDVSPSRPWVRALVLIAGVAGSAVIGYVTAVVVMIIAVLLDAAPLLAGETTTQQPWVTPTAVGAGLIVFGLGVWLSVRMVRRRPGS